MARALLIGCGCCALEAGRLLIDGGWQVRGTSRDPGRLERIARAGIEPVEADPDRAGTIAELLGDVTVLAWLLGSARGSAAELEALHAQRLPSLLEKVADSPVRGVVYEVAGAGEEHPLARGREAVEDAGRRWRIPTRVIEVDRGEPGEWARAVSAAAVELVGG